MRLTARLPLALLAVSALALPLCARAQEAPAAQAPTPTAAAPLDPAALAAERGALALPDDVWNHVLDAVGRPAGRIGYTSDEMRNYGGAAHLLRTVDNLFRDVRAVPRETGRVTDDLIAAGAAGEIDVLLQRCWGLLDTPAGRMFPRVPRDGWGVDWIAPDASPTAVLAAIRAQVVADSRLVPQGLPAPDFDGTSVEALPPAVQRLVARLALGAFEAARFVGDTPDLAGFAPAEFDETFARLRATWPGPWRDEEHGLSVTREHRVLDMLSAFESGRQAYASVVLAAHLRTALEEIREADTVAATETRTIDLGWGSVVVAGTGPDSHEFDTLPHDTWCVIDLGGDDTWHGAFATPFRRTALPVALALDLSGDDTWDAAGESCALGCGANGIGMLIDLGGNDRYAVQESGLGCAWFGTGLLWDAAGDDTYVVERAWGEGAAHAGVGVLLDAGGNDRYECAEQSQGLGATLGTGLLLDLGGDDAYVCRDDGNVSDLYLGQSVAMAQGCGYGRRADLGDGRSLAGGWGLLVDAAGDDHYHAQCWAQGAGYWWGVGVLEDRGGNDVYENGKYSSGAAAHFAIGVHVDVAGDDSYNQGVTTTKNQFQGHARDGSVGVFVDGAGDDHYLLRNLCAGGADLASIALFWDRLGDDVYEAVLDKVTDWAREPFGSAAHYGPFRSFRDDLVSFGIFLDTGGGSDRYPAETAAGNDAQWTDAERPNARAVGIDD